MGFTWTTTPEEAFGALYDAYVRRLYMAVYVLCQRRKPDIENWLKDNAPWTDRTGNARQTLWSGVDGNGQVIVITLSHGMTYGYWLEVANAGRFAIVTPGVDHWGTVLMQDIQRLIR